MISGDTTTPHPLFSRYADLKHKMHLLQVQIDALSPEILREMESMEADKVQTDDGAFVVTSRKNWKFSPAVSSLEERLEEKKKEEMANGTATFEKKSILKFIEKE